MDNNAPKLQYLIEDEREIRLENISFYFKGNVLHLGKIHSNWFYDFTSNDTFEMVNDDFIDVNGKIYALNMALYLYIKTPDYFKGVMQFDCKKSRDYAGKYSKDIYKKLNPYLDPVRETYTIKEYKEISKLYNACLEVVSRTEGNYIIL